MDVREIQCPEEVCTQAVFLSHCCEMCTHSRAKHLFTKVFFRPGCCMPWVRVFSSSVLCTCESLKGWTVDLEWLTHIPMMLFLDTSEARGGECDPSAYVSSHSTSTDCETGELSLNHVIFLTCFGWTEKKSASSSIIKCSANKSVFWMSEMLFHKDLFSLQVVPKPINSTSQIVTTSQPQQRLIMPATPLPQIQPNLTNLPPGTVLAPAPGTGNVGYAVLPAQYVTQVRSFPEMLKETMLLWNILPSS